MKVLGTFSATINDKTKVRPKREKLELIKDHGIKNDKFALKNLEQSVLIVPIDAYNITKDEGIDLEFGSLGENILVDFNIMQIPVNTQIKIGDAIVEITQKCTMCNHLSVFDKRVPKLVKDHRGVYCKIIKSGIIQKGMEVEICQIRES